MKVLAITTFSLLSTAAAHAQVAKYCDGATIPYGLKAGIDSVHGVEATIDALARLAPSGLTVVGVLARSNVPAAS